MIIPEGYYELDFVGFSDKGDYLTSEEYVKNDLVHYRNNIWKCLVDETINKTPEEGIYWSLWLQGGSGDSGGITNYNDLSNKPKINNITLEGNKSATDLGILSAYEQAVEGGYVGTKDDFEKILGGISLVFVGTTEEWENIENKDLYGFVYITDEE